MTQTNISYERRQYIKSVVLDAYEHFGNTKLPLEIKAFTRSYINIRLISYSKRIKRMGVSYSYMTSIAKDSYTDYYADVGMYYIYYNDIDQNIVTSNRYRWNIAHELGHVLLGHLRDNEKTRLTRPALPDDEYLYLEEEADYFAQLILVPHSPLWGFNIQNANHIKLLCKISPPASRKRMYEYNAWKHNGQPLDDYDNRILKYYYSYVYKKKCKNCGAGIVQRYGKYCPICGSKNTLQWGDGKMNYKNWAVDENGRLEKCVICENTTLIGPFCQICGSPVENKCTDFLDNPGFNRCSNEGLLPANARYCHICGSESLFKQRKMLCTWQEEFKKISEKENDNLQNGFSSIPEQVDFFPEFTNLFANFPDGIDEELPFN